MKKFIFAIVACALSCISASAQEYVDAPYDFLSIRGGGQTILLKQNAGDMQISPAAGLSLGSMFSPYVGARLDLEGIWNKVDIKNAGKAEWKSITTDIDVLFNISNYCRENVDAPFSFYLLGGVGYICNWDTPSQMNKALADNVNFRLGAIADWRLSRITSLNLELDGNYMCGSESEVIGDGKWKVAAFLGLTFKLPHTPKAIVPTSTAAPVTSQSEYDAAAAQAAEAAAAAAAAKKAREAELARKAAAERAATAAAAAAQPKQEPIEETIFFTIGKTDKAEKWDQVVDAAAAWCKKYSDKTITVAGYADKGTGTAAVNARVAKARATKVANAIKAKGVPADQIKVASYGDTVQPFNENDQNRCVIVSGK